MKQLYVTLILLTLLTPTLTAQNCSSLTATFTSFESRCAATGAIKVKAKGGSGSYKYRVSGPVNLNFTTVDSITGLSSGTYSVEVIDIQTGCNFTGHNIYVAGSYVDPRFVLETTDVGCHNGNNGAILVQNAERGRAPFIFSIVAPSAMGVGTSNSDGIFTGLKAGNYTIRLTDSCGGIQTRTATINNYTWSIQGHDIVKTSCDQATGTIKVKDSRGSYSHTAGISGMLYGVLNAPGDTTWSSNPKVTFNATGKTSTEAFAKDMCGTVQKVSVNLNFEPSIGAQVAVANRSCSTFTARVQNVKNMFSPNFKIYNSANTLVGTNTDGEFQNLPYGTYTIIATDACSGATFNRTVTASAAVVSVASKVQLSNYSCSTFTARITGITNATRPTFRLLDANNNLVDTNTSGQFPNIPYGSYCIEMNDGCVDTTIVRCFQGNQPKPQIDSLKAAYITCDVFGLNIKGDSIYSAIYCLYDANGKLIRCDSNGKFDNIPLGDYCVTINDLCADTTLTRCISVPKPVLINDMTVSISPSCSTFNATVRSTNIKNGTYSVYTSDDVFVDSSTTGQFTGLPYGDYYVLGTTVCPDTTVRKDFSATPVKPTGTLKLNTANRRCDIFDLSVSGLSNLSNATYILKNSSGAVISSGSSSTFRNIPYGNYCVEVENGPCYDTTFTACNDFQAPARTSNVSVNESCYYGHTRLNITASTYPVTVSVFTPSNVLLVSRYFANAGKIDSLPELPAGQQYTVRSEWSCGQPITTTITPVSSFLNHSATAEQLCPGSVWPNGSGNITATVTTNAGALTVRLYKKDNQVVNAKPDEVSGSEFRFNNLGPAAYILSYIANDGCSNTFYDTVIIAEYLFPDLNQTSAFQCDQNGFSVGAHVNNGVGPFTYEIMNSAPESPSIASGPQSSPIFNIDNGSEYMLIRLRALDACGNATLADASILPLASNKIKGITDNCIGTRVVLSIDTMINSTVKWSYKKNETDPVAIPLGDGFALEIGTFSYDDIGFYYCEVTMNNGCIIRNYEFALDGTCHGVLPLIDVDLKGRMIDERSHLEWTIENGQDLKSIDVERNDGNGFRQIGKVDVRETNGYTYVDNQPATENQYRLKLVFEGGKTVYTKIVRLDLRASTSVNVYPNPATDFVTVNFGGITQSLWQVELINANGQQVMKMDQVSGQLITIKRNTNMPSGMYLLKLRNTKTGETENHKVIFK